MTMPSKKPHLLFIFIACLTITLCFTTCKKYPEDGKYSWHKPDKRLSGIWYIKEYMVDNIDSSRNNYIINNTYNGVLSWQLFDARFTFSSGVDKKSSGQNIDIYVKNVSQNSITGCNSCYIHSVNNWLFIDKKKNNLLFKSLGTYFNTDTVEVSFSIFSTPKNDTWLIRKLTDKELILEGYNFYNKHIRIKFQK